MHNADEFLRYIAENEKALKKALKKNITYDAEIFDDCWQESIIKVYNSIVKNDRYVDDFKNYSFMAFKWNYVNRQNQHRKRKSVHTDIEEYRESSDFVYEHFVDTDDDSENRLKMLEEYLNMTTKPADTRLFLDYHRAKCSGSGSYKSIAEEYNLKIADVKETIQKISSILESGDFDKYCKDKTLL